jgi:hypothetical protein
MVTIRTTFETGKTQVQQFKDLQTFKDSKTAKKTGIKFVELIEPITQIVLALISLLKKK